VRMGVILPYVKSDNALGQFNVFIIIIRPWPVPIQNYIYIYLFISIIINLLFVSCFRIFNDVITRKCGSPDVPLHHVPSQPVTGIALPLLLISPAEAQPL
jgi:hypothetical protein